LTLIAGPVARQPHPSSAPRALVTRGAPARRAGRPRRAPPALSTQVSFGIRAPSDHDRPRDDERHDCADGDHGYHADRARNSRQRQRAQRYSSYVRLERTCDRSADPQPSQGSGRCTATSMDRRPPRGCERRSMIRRRSARGRSDTVAIAVTRRGIDRADRARAKSRRISECRARPSGREQTFGESELDGG
jgi:hypothetical protein